MYYLVTLRAAKLTPIGSKATLYYVPRRIHRPEILSGGYVNLFLACLPLQKFRKPLDDASEALRHLVPDERDVLIMKGNLAPASRRHFRFNNHEIIFDRAISETGSRDIPRPSSCPRY